MRPSINRITRIGRWRLAGRAPLAPAVRAMIPLVMALAAACAADDVSNPGDVTGNPALTPSQPVSNAGGPDLATGAISSAVPAPLPLSTGPTFYVAPTGNDANPGTQSAPWKSIQKAMNALRSGQKALVRAGTYKTGGAFGTNADTYTWLTACSASAPCSIMAYPGERPVLHGQLRIKGSYLRLSGFIIEGPLSAKVASCSGRRANQVDLSDADHTEFSYNEVRFNDYHAGITAYRVNHIQVLNNYVHDNGRFTLSNDPCTGTPTTQVDHGIYWGGTDGGGNLIADNLVIHNRAKGIQLYPATYDVIVSDNTSVDNGDAGILVSGGSDRITIVNNVAAFNGNRQIRILSGNANRVERNIAYSPTKTSASIQNATSSTVTGNILADPLLKSRTGKDYHLTSTSPAIGLASLAYSLRVDNAGTPRPKGAAPDAGAFEY